MKYPQIITSILDNDLYKFSMQSAVIKNFPNAFVNYEFINRGKSEFPDGFGAELREQVQALQNVVLTEVELEKFKRKAPFLDPTYFTFLMGYRFNPSQVGIIQQGTDLKVTVEGYWFETILWEVVLMSIISELYFLTTNQKRESEYERKNKLDHKAQFFTMNNLLFADFGTRRRFSFTNHEEVVKHFAAYSKKNFVGTSNVYFATKYDLKPIGTHAHEWFMFMAAKYGYKMANTMALKYWSKTYQGNLGIALSDTFTTDVFFRSFDTFYAKLFDGVRHDSGDPIEFAKKVINHYEKLGIDPTTKTIVFSDGLNLDVCEKIYSAVKGQIRMSFGIGTFFTNDVGVKPLNIVIKMTKAKPCNMGWEDTVKLSDNPGKHTGTEKEINIAKSILHLVD